MGATNTTTHYELSQFVSTDKPAWLQDYNGDMLKIDTAIDAAKVAADTAQTTANSVSGAVTQNTNDITALQTDVSGQGNNITALQLAVNTINSLIGNGTPTTTDQTLIGAINEINAKINKVIYNNATAQSLISAFTGAVSDIRGYAGSDRHKMMLQFTTAEGGTFYYHIAEESATALNFGMVGTGTEYYTIGVSGSTYQSKRCTLGTGSVDWNPTVSNFKVIVG